MRFVIFLAAGLAPAAFGGTITTLSGLGANDLINFGNSPAGTILGATSNGGIAMTFFAPLFVSMQGQGWAGDFPANTVVVINQTGGEAEFDFFSTPIQGFGLTVDDGYGGGFTETIDVFTAGIPYPIYVDQTSVFEPPNTLSFLGILEPTADISVVTVSIAGTGGNNDFAFGNLSLVDATAPTATPEPGTNLLTLAGAGLLMLLRKARAQRCPN
jgi:hypothetical protein